MNRTATWIGVATLGLAIASGCSVQQQASSGTESDAAKPKQPELLKDIRIAMIAKSSNNPVFGAARVGAEAAAKELSAKHKINVKVDWLTPPTEDGEEQARRIAQAVNDGANAILISCSDAAKVTGAINDAVDKGIAVMTFDSDAPDSKRFAFFGTNDESCGKQVMQELSKQLGGKGVVAILAGNQNAPNLQKRVKGVKDESTNHPDVTIKGVYYHAETPQDAAAEVRRVMNANPEITGWAMVGGWPLFSTALLDLDPAKIDIVAVDALPAQLAYVNNGVAPVLVAQPIYDWGSVSVGMIVDKLALGKDVKGVHNMELVYVTKATLGDWARQLKAWGFNDVDKKYLAM